MKKLEHRTLQSKINYKHIVPRLCLMPIPAHYQGNSIRIMKWRKLLWMYPTSDAHYCFTAVHPLLKSVPDYSHPSNFQFPQYYVVTYLSSYQQHDFLTPVVRVDSRSVQAIMSQTFDLRTGALHRRREEEERKKWKQERRGKRDTSHIMAPTFWGWVGCRSVSHIIILLECSTGVPM